MAMPGMQLLGKHKISKFLQRKPSIDKGSGIMTKGLKNQNSTGVKIMEIKVTISLDERTHSVLNRLIAALGESKKNATTIVTTVNSANDDNEWTGEEMREAMKEMQDVYATQDDYADAVDETPAPAPKKAIKPVSDGVSASKKDKPKVTQEDLRALAADVKTKTGSVDKVKALLNAYSAKNISALPADKWDEFAAKLRELL